MRQTGNLDISLLLNGTSHKWSFAEGEAGDFYHDVLDNVKKSMGAGYFDHREEIIKAWYIDPNALEELRDVIEPLSQEERKNLALEQNKIGLIAISAETKNGINPALLETLADAKKWLTRESLPVFFNEVNENCAPLMQRFEEEYPIWIHPKLEIHEHLVPIYFKQEGNRIVVTYPISKTEYAQTMHAFLGEFYSLLGLTISSEWETMDISMIEFQMYTEK